jgi:single-strand DNA-binding protein
MGSKCLETNPKITRRIMKATATILGRLGAEPETKEISTGTMVILSIATNKRYKGEKMTVWHKVRVFGRTAENVLQWLHKGDTALFYGDLDYEEFTAKDGTEMKKAVIIARDVTFVSVPKERVEDPMAPKPAPKPAHDPDDTIPF